MPNSNRKFNIYYSKVDFKRNKLKSYGNLIIKKRRECTQNEG